MIWIEMSVDENHGGSDWGFTRCLWSPSYKMVKEKRQKWAYWDCLLRVKADDVILHLRGEKDSKFVGYSIAESDGFKTELCPPQPGQKWKYADSFYRVNLTGYQEFQKPIYLKTLFDEKESELSYYFSFNKKRSKDTKKLLFYAIQKNKLGRQNGAYLSEVDEALCKIILERTSEQIVNESGSSNVKTGETLRDILVRKGQADFSDSVRENFKQICCYPGCDIKERSFLIGSHIARWSDFPKHRGNIANGLCLCLMHDKAFEKGLFTLDKNLCISVNKKRISNCDESIHRLLEHNGEPIKQSDKPVDVEFIKHHWTRIGYKPE